MSRWDTSALFVKFLFIGQLVRRTDYQKPCHCEERSDVAISKTSLVLGDCHNQSADWFRNDVRWKKLSVKQKFDSFARVYVRMRFQDFYCLCRCYRIKQISPVAPSLTIRVRVPLNFSRTSSGVRINFAVKPS